MTLRPLSIGNTQQIVVIETRAPTAADDGTLGYKVGQFWLDTLHQLAYQLASAATGAAVWIALAGGGGGSGIVWRGDWDSATTYAVNDVVSYLGGSYLALLVNINIMPDSLAPNWGQLAAPGISQAYADAHYRTKNSRIHTQGVAASTWTIVHNLGTYPAVTVEDSTGQVVDAEIHYVDVNSLEVRAAFAFSGQAFLT